LLFSAHGKKIIPQPIFMGLGIKKTN